MVPKILIKADSRFPINRKKIRELVVKILKAHGLENGVEVSLAIVGSRKMKALNKQYRCQDKTTSILVFPLEDGRSPSGFGFAKAPDNILRLGDIIIAYPQALKQAAKKNILLDEEIESLVKHGMKHLLGMNKF